MALFNILILLLSLYCINALEAPGRIPLPDKFLLGAGSTAYQTEGGWNLDYKSESIWDAFVHEHPDLVVDGSNADIAADTYHHFEENIKALKFMHLNTYRFSISWPRILPKGDLSMISKAGLRYYNHLINRLIEENIEPVVTMFNWDLPNCLQTQFGGWTNRIVVDYFEDYAWLLFNNFGDRVKYWVTINEPHLFCLGYGSAEIYPPLIHSPGHGDYLCDHNLLLAHGKVANLYNKEFRATQNGQIGISMNFPWAEPKTQNAADIKAAADHTAFQIDFYVNPIFSENGDYPTVVRERILRNSLEQGLRRSRLPQFTPSEIEMLKGSTNFLGLNYYESVVAAAGKEGLEYSRDWNKEAILYLDPALQIPESPLMPYNPKGLYKALVYIHEKYPKVDILITENGIPDEGEINDKGRIESLTGHLREALRAIKDHNVPLIGYIHWALLDSFEWLSGYKLKFGLCQVNFTDPNRARKYKLSSWIYQDIAKQWSVSDAKIFDEGTCDKDKCS